MPKIILTHHIDMFIIIAMNIYITPTNEQKLRQYVHEHDHITMSGLINNLLRERLWPTTELNTPVEPPPVASVSLTRDRVTPSKPKRPSTAMPPISEVIKNHRGTCKNGHILQYGRDKCSTPGCKYAS
jgi:hypothetical protein